MCLFNTVVVNITPRVFDKEKEEDEYNLIKQLDEEEFLENRTNDDGTKGKKVLRDDIAKLLQKSEYQITINVKLKN